MWLFITQMYRVDYNHLSKRSRGSSWRFMEGRVGSWVVGVGGCVVMTNVEEANEIILTLKVGGTARVTL